MAVLDRAITSAGACPPHLVSDQGPQFRAQFQAWCGQRGIKPRFGAIGRYGSIAIVERLIGSMKREGLRAELLPLAFVQFRTALAAYFDWYQHDRPHQGLGGWTRRGSSLALDIRLIVRRERNACARPGSRSAALAARSSCRSS